MKILMIGPGREVKGGISTVVNQYYVAGLDERVELKYIATMQDGSKIKKTFIVAKALMDFNACVKRYDIVHVHMSSRASFVRKSIFIRLAMLWHKKVIIHMHGSEFDVFYDAECNKRQQRKVRQTFSYADAVIALSEEWKEYLKKICDSKKISVLHNAVAMPQYERVDYTDHNVLFLGRLGKRKGTFDLLKAIPQVLERVPDSHFYFGGDGDVNEVCEIVKDIGIEESFTYLGWTVGVEKEKMLKHCSTFVLPSYHEGMPMALLEAMSYGAIAVTTTVGGIPNIIDNGTNGYLCQPGDIEGLADCLIKALSGADREAIGRNSYKTICEDYNIDKNIGKLEQLYTSLVMGIEFDKEQN